MSLQLQKLRLAARQAARSGAGAAQAPQQNGPATSAPATCCPGQEGSANADIPVPAPKSVKAGKKGKGKTAQETHGKAAPKEEKSKVRRGSSVWSAAAIGDNAFSRSTRKSWHQDLPGQPLSPASQEQL